MRNGWIALLGSVIIIGALVYVMRPKSTPTPTSTSGTPATTPATQLRFFCAAGIKPPVAEVAKEYQKLYNVRLELQYQGSGTLLSSIDVTRTGDLYLAADQSYMDIAREKGLIDEVIPLVHMRAVIGVAAGNPKKIQGPDDLLREDVRVALANPDAASIGRQTKKLLTKTGHWERIQKAAAVFKPTVTEIANDVKLGTVDAAIIWDATANQYDEIDIVHVDAFDKAVKTTSIAVLKSCQNPTAALRFCRYLGARDKGLQVFKRWGYEPVRGDLWAEKPELLFYSGGVNRLAIQDTIKEFEEREGVTVNTVYNGCGILVGQMKAGARPDAYFACDVSFIKQVKDLFEDPREIAQTQMVIVVPKGNPRDIETLKDLTAPGLKIGMANPKQSALGALTERLLKQEGILEPFMKNVRSQTPTADLLVNQMLAGPGSLDAVIVYRVNTAYAREKLTIIPIDSPAATAIQPFAIAHGTDYPMLMSRLLDRIRSAQSQQRFKSVGFNWRDLGPEDIADHANE